MTPARKRSITGHAYMSDADIYRYCEWALSLSPRQKLEMARQGKLL